MAWFVLFLAGILEIVWAVALKYSKGFERLWPSLFVVGVGFLSLWLLSIAVKSLPLGTAYAIWTGIGIVGTVIYGILFFNEPYHALRLAFILCIFVGIIGLKCVT